MTILGICLTIGYVAVGTFAMIAFGIMKCEEGTQDGCGLIMPVYYPYVDTDFGVGRYAVQVVQVIGGFGCAICTFVISWIYITHSEFLNTYMDQLKVMLAAIAKDPDFYRRRWRFRECVMYHQRILELANELMPLSSNIYVVHVVNSPIIMSMIVYQLMLEFNVIFFMHLLLWTYATSIGCVVGQRLSDMVSNY
ncbi:uncharacterized protein [Atheta coriaria]|uniref:uncharacterized protein n=1 Tax=Dalotia coriaria TaxID=877792 RepID=UPI0031F38040